MGHLCVLRVSVCLCLCVMGGRPVVRRSVRRAVGAAARRQRAPSSRPPPPAASARSDLARPDQVHVDATQTRNLRRVDVHEQRLHQSAPRG